MKISSLNTQYKAKFNIHRHNKQVTPKNITINKNRITPYNVSFCSAIPVDDNNFFNIDNEMDFNIEFNKFIFDKLNNYKISAESKDSVYMTDKKESNIRAKKNATLYGSSEASSIISDIADLYENSKADKIKTQRLYLFDNSNVVETDTESTILADNSEVSYSKASKNSWLINDSNAHQINTDNLYQRNNAKAGDVLAQKIFIRDKALIDKAQAKNIVMKDKARINNAFVENGTIKLLGNSVVENLNPENSKVLIDENAKVQTIASDSNIEITGNGTVGNIYTKGTSVIIRGPLKLEGKIVFADKNGHVIAQKEPYNIYPKIENESVENGILEFLMNSNNKILIGNPGKIFEDGIQIAEKIMPEEQSAQTSVFSDLTYLIKYYKSSNPKLSDKISAVIKSEDEGVARKLFNDFYNSTLKSFNSYNGKKAFSLRFADKAMLGEINLVDFWLASIEKNPETADDKIIILNNLTTKDKRKITDATIEYWIDNILPEQINTCNHNDINSIQNDINFVKSLIKKIKESPEEFKKDIDNKSFYKKLSSAEVNQQKIVDLWINSFQSDNLKTERLKREYLKNLISNQETRGKIISITKENIENAQQFLDKYKDACQDIIDNEDDISKTEKSLIKVFRNDKNLYNYSFNKTKDKSNKAEIESVILSAISQVANEYEGLSLNAQKEIFRKVLKLQDLIQSDKNSQIHKYVNFIFNEYGQMLALQNPNQVQDEQEQLVAFKQYVKKNSLFFENLWKNIVNSSLKFYLSNTLDNINTNNIRMLASVSKRLPQNSPLEKLINGIYLDRIEQRDFISRYQNDPNFVTLMGNDGINKKEVIENLLMTEAVNDILYQQRIQSFNEDINPSSVMENLDIADKYLKISNMDYSSMSLQEKTEVLSKIPQEELSMISKITVRDWRNNELVRFMSDKFVSTQLEYNINAQSKNIRDLLSNMCEYLNSINVNIQGQNYTLYELTQNIDKIAKLNEKSFKELYFIGQNIEAINSNTESMKSNIKAILYNVMQNSRIKDPELTANIKSLLPENERGSLTEFISKVNVKSQEIKDEKRKSQLKSLANLVLIAAGATGFEFLGGDILGKMFGSGETMTKVTSALCGIARTVKHVSILKAATTGMKRD